MSVTVRRLLAGATVMSGLGGPRGRPYKPDVGRTSGGSSPRLPQGLCTSKKRVSGHLHEPLDNPTCNESLRPCSDRSAVTPVHFWERFDQCADGTAVGQSSKSGVLFTIANARKNSVRVEASGPASLALRLAPAALTPLKWMLNAMTAAGKFSPITTKSLFAITSCTDRFAAPLVPPRGILRIPVTCGKGLRGEWLWRDDNIKAVREAGAAILYIHGGAFISCGINTHRRLAAKIGQAADIPILNIAYRQLPAAHITDTIDDCVTAYKYLLDNGFPARRIIIAGDSAGGGLAFLTAMTARRRALPMPAGIVALSPFTDLDNTFRINHPNAGRDPYIPTEALGVLARWGFHCDSTLDPAWSPINGDFTGLPPILVQVGSTEILLSDAERLAQRCAESNVPCTLQIWDRAPHVFQIGSDLLPEARVAIHDVATFVQHQIRR